MTLVADELVRRLRQWGIQRIFGYSGDGIDPILGALRRAGDDPEFVAARHEENAAFMACGHAKYTGGVGCCIATHGPGAIHLLNGLYDAKLDKRPVVALIAQQHRSALGSTYQQEIDAQTLFKDVCAEYLQTVMVPEQLRLVVDRALRTAVATRSPTGIIIPHDTQQLDMPEELPHEHGVVPSAVGLHPPRVLPSEVGLEEARRPQRRPAGGDPRGPGGGAGRRRGRGGGGAARGGGGQSPARQGGPARRSAVRHRRRRPPRHDGQQATS